jgi:hypothetical protein
MWKQFKAHSWEARLALLIVALAGSYAIGDAVVAPAPAPAEPGFIDTVLGSRAVVAAIRIAIVFTAASVVALMKRGRWLSRIGPVHVSDEVVELDGNWQENELSARMEEYVEVLRRDLAETGDLIQQAARDQEERDGH